MHFRALTAGVLALGVLLATPVAAHSAFAPTTTIDGPSSDIVDLGNVAMAEDATGGLVYLKREGNRTHVFASRFVDAAWTAPQRVDRPGPYGTQAFDSSWPQIGAGEGGRLVVTWVQEFGEGTDRLFSASLDPGATRFQDPVPIDLNVGEATATYPSLEMNRGGQAYLSYRIVNRAGALPPDSVNSDTRTQRYNGSVWTQFGSVADRNPSQPTRTPNERNSPRVGIDSFGNGIVAFQEPDDSFIDRIWARRLFGTSQGIPVLVSPQKIGPDCNAPPAGGEPTTPGGAPTQPTPGAQPTQPGAQPEPGAGAPPATRRQDPPPAADCKDLRAPADQFSLSVAGLGEGAVAFRQQPGERSGLTEPRVFVSTIPDVNNEVADRFRPARPADPPLTGGNPGPPSVAITPGGTFQLAFGRDTATFVASSDDATVSDPTLPLPEPERIDDATSSVAGDPVVELGTLGSGVTAYETEAGGRGAVTLRERLLDGTATVGVASGSSGGPVGLLDSSGSGLGDALVAFRQGGASFRQIVATAVDVAPGEFAVTTPFEFVRAKTYPLEWQRPPDAFGGLTYAVKVDGEVVVQGLTELEAQLDRTQLGNGVHAIVIEATDRAGQVASSFEGEARVDRSPPGARAVRAKRRMVRVVVSDGPRGRTSGAVAGATSIAFGDGGRVRRKVRAEHRYRRSGTYRVTVKARDAAGNRAVRTLKVRVR